LTLTIHQQVPQHGPVSSSPNSGSFTASSSSVSSSPHSPSSSETISSVVENFKKPLELFGFKAADKDNQFEWTYSHHKESHEEYDNPPKKDEEFHYEKHTEKEFDWDNFDVNRFSEWLTQIGESLRTLMKKDNSFFEPMDAFESVVGILKKVSNSQFVRDPQELTSKILNGLGLTEEDLLKMKKYFMNDQDPKAAHEESNSEKTTEEVKREKNNLNEELIKIVTTSRETKVKKEETETEEKEQVEKQGDTQLPDCLTELISSRELILTSVENNDFAISCKGERCKKCLLWLYLVSQ